MINVKISWNMFRMQISTQIDDHNFKKNGATYKKYILRNKGSKFQSHKFKVLCKIALCKNQKWLNKVMFQFPKKLKLYTELVPRTVRLLISIFFVIVCISPSSSKVFLTLNIITMNYCFICKINIRVNFLKMLFVASNAIFRPCQHIAHCEK